MIFVVVLKSIKSSSFQFPELPENQNFTESIVYQCSLITEQNHFLCLYTSQKTSGRFLIDIKMSDMQVSNVSFVTFFRPKIQNKKTRSNCLLSHMCTFSVTIVSV